MRRWATPSHKNKKRACDPGFCAFCPPAALQARDSSQIVRKRRGRAPQNGGRRKPRRPEVLIGNTMVIYSIAAAMLLSANSMRDRCRRRDNTPSKCYVESAQTPPGPLTTHERPTTNMSGYPNVITTGAREEVVK